MSTVHHLLEGLLKSGSEGQICGIYQNRLLKSAKELNCVVELSLSEVCFSFDCDYSLKT